MSLAHRVGRRGSCLLFFGFLDLVYGGSLAWPSADTRVNPLFAYLARLVPLQVYGAAWLAIGVVLVASAFLFADEDRVAFFFASFVKFLWAILSFAAWAGGSVPRGYAGAAIWAALAGFVLVLAGWPEPTRPGGGDGGAR